MFGILKNFELFFLFDKFKCKFFKRKPSLLYGSSYDLIYVIGCINGESKRYRVHNINNFLKNFGFKTLVINSNNSNIIEDKNISAKSIIIFRASLANKKIRNLVEYCKIKKIKIIFDVDDLIFMPEIINQIYSVKIMSYINKRRYLLDVIGYRDLLKKSDKVIVPTEFLKSVVTQLEKKCSVIPNTLNENQKYFSERNQKKINSDKILVGYFSGSKTHEADFLECEEAIFQKMSDVDNLYLKIVGYLNLDKKWDIFGDRVIRKNFCDEENMLRELLDCDINIAPLELGNIFCDGKSELKYFEAALLQVPTIASSTATFSGCINSWSNGVLASTAQDWGLALEKLIFDSDLRSRLGESAKLHAIQNYYIDNNLEKILLGYDIDYFVKNKKENYNITFIVPGIKLASGGHRNIFRIAYYLSKYGHNVTLLFTDTLLSPGYIKYIISENYYPIDCNIELYSGEIKLSEDIIIATHWKTVDIALLSKDKASLIYFIQDFEPAFYPMSAEYIMSENTYKSGLYCICSGRWIADYLKRNYLIDADYFNFPIDKQIYYKRNRKNTNKRILFFAKPEMPRRCFKLGMRVMQIIKSLKPEIEIVLFGSNQIFKEHLNFDCVKMGQLPDLNSLAELYSSSDIGVVFSTTNPSLIPYEMMACGLPVVDLKREGNQVNYDDRFDIAKLCSPVPEEMASEILELISSADEMTARSINGLIFTDDFPSEEVVARSFEKFAISYHEKNTVQSSQIHTNN